MGISLTIFLGSKDPNLIFSLNQCQTDCCLIDPDDVEKFIGALPAFTMDQFEDILAYTLNIFRQFTFPGYVFQIEKATGARKEKLESCRERLEKSPFVDDEESYYISSEAYRLSGDYKKSLEVVNEGRVKYPEGYMVTFQYWNLGKITGNDQQENDGWSKVKGLYKATKYGREGEAYQLAFIGREFSQLAGSINVTVPDEKSKRHGQAVAAASLPSI